MPLAILSDRTSLPHATTARGSTYPRTAFANAAGAAALPAVSEGSRLQGYVRAARLSCHATRQPPSRQRQASHARLSQGVHAATTPLAAIDGRQRSDTVLVAQPDPDGDDYLSLEPLRSPAVTTTPSSLQPPVADPPGHSTVRQQRPLSSPSPRHKAPRNSPGPEHPPSREEGWVSRPGQPSQPLVPRQLTAYLLQSTSLSSLHFRLQQHADSSTGISTAAAITHLAKLVSVAKLRRDNQDGAFERNHTHDGDQRQGQGRGQGQSSQARARDRTPDGAQGRPPGQARSRSVAEDLRLAHTTLRLAMQLLQPHLPDLTTRGYANIIWACAKIATCAAGASAPAPRGVASGPATRAPAAPETPRAESVGRAGAGAAAAVPAKAPAKLSRGKKHLRRQCAEGQAYNWAGSSGGPALPSGGGRGAGAGDDPGSSLEAMAVSAACCVTDALVHYGKARYANTQDLANTCYGLAVLGLGQHRAWREGLLPRAAQLAPSLQSHSLSNIFWSLGRLQLRPDDRTLGLLVAQARRLLLSKGAAGAREGGESLTLLPKPELKGAAVRLAKGGAIEGRLGQPAAGSAGRPADSPSAGGSVDLEGRQESGNGDGLGNGDLRSDSGDGTARGTSTHSVAAAGPASSAASPQSKPRQQQAGAHSPAARFHGSGEPEHAWPQFLSNVTWALAKLQMLDKPYMRAMAKACASILDQANSQSISNLLWAIACLDPSQRDVFITALPRVKTLAHQGKLTPQSIANVAWAYAKVSCYDAELFDALAVSAVPLLHRFNSQDLSNTAWAYGQTSHRDKSLFAGIARAALPLVPSMNNQELSQLVWSMATLNFASESLCSTISIATSRQLEASNASQRAAAASASEPAPTASSMQSVGLVDIAGISSAERQQANAAHDGSGSGAVDAGPGLRNTGWHMQAVSNVAWAFSIMRPGDTRIFAALFRQADQILATHMQGDGSEQRSQTSWPPPTTLEPGKSSYEDAHSADVRHARQLFQAHMAHQLACISGQASPAGSIAAELSPSSLSWCRRAWKGLVSDVVSSRNQLAVLELLRSLGHTCKSEQVLAHGLFCVDILVTHRDSGATVVVEVDGPFHYARNDPTKPLGELLLRNRFIRALGYTLVCVPYFELQALSGDEAQRRYLDEKLTAATQEGSGKGQLGVAPAVAEAWVEKLLGGGKGGEQREKRLGVRVGKAGAGAGGPRRAGGGRRGRHVTGSAAARPLEAEARSQGADSSSKDSSRAKARQGGRQGQGARQGQGLQG